MANSRSRQFPFGHPPKGEEILVVHAGIQEEWHRWVDALKLPAMYVPIGAALTGYRFKRIIISEYAWKRARHYGSEQEGAMAQQWYDHLRMMMYPENEGIHIIG